ncbi:DUF885 family protein [Sandarakinorhabdus sp. DWP1-3-1]|uniref:DUF885 family protein n=1 Tax=Sandarakinorhabdus sp. DWP1-3-1 TaxID=2804627 RepID=UPI003CE86352
MTSDELVDAYLAHHFAFRPVDATFMGVAGHDHRLPPAGPGTAAAERAGLAALRDQLAATPAGETSGQRLDRRYVEAQLTLGEAALDHAPRLANPAWYSGEAAFGIVSLLLPHPGPSRGDALAARLAAIPGFLAAAEAQLTAAPRAVTDRAMRESASFSAYLDDQIRRHPDWNPAWNDAATAAAAAFDHFAAAIANLPDAPSATGRAYLELLMTAGHGLDCTPETALARAEADYARLGDELIALAAANDPARSWQEQVAGLSQITAETPDTVIDLYRKLDAEAVAAAPDLVTPATEYALEYRRLPPDFARIAADLYFLPYRSPPAATPADGSIYWVHPPGGADYLAANAVAPVKIIHAVHHGSIGHHTQNARARAAPSRLARLAGTDCALGLAMLPSGTMVEGWACYAQDLMAEAPGFYSATERVFLKQFERRNAASVIVDINLHTGAWTPGQAMDFYAAAGFAPSRIAAEVTRNAMLPATRLMYWLGIEAIRALRRRWRGSTIAFHDTLIGHGHVPIAWAADEMALAGQLD